jgi:hypothetical protein
MLAALLCNYPHAGRRATKWRNKYGVFDSLEEARAAAQDEVVEEVVEIEETPGWFVYTPERPTKAEAPIPRRQTDDAALFFILANL